MYLKTHKRKKNGKVNEYYSIVEKRKVANGFYVQKTVLYLGEISDSQKKSWNKSIKVLNEQDRPIHKTLFALHDDDDICENINAIPLVFASYLTSEITKRRLRPDQPGSAGDFIPDSVAGCFDSNP